MLNRYPLIALAGGSYLLTYVCRVCLSPVKNVNSRVSAPCMPLANDQPSGPSAPLRWLVNQPSTLPSDASVADLVVTRYGEKVSWVTRLVRDCAMGGCWHAYIYTTGTSVAPQCHEPNVFCAHAYNKGNEWSGYMSHLVHRYGALAELTVFLQGDPFTVSPDLLCLLNARRNFRPVQALSWVQKKKRRWPLFQCNASYIGRCRVWVEPVSSGYRPLLHGDRYLAGTFVAAKQWKGILAPWAIAQLLGSHLTPDAPSQQLRWRGSLYNHTWLAERLAAAAAWISGGASPTPRAPPPMLYRAYGAQFGASRQALLALPRSVYEHILRWVHADKSNPELSLGFSFVTRQKGLLLELAWMTLWRAHEFLQHSGEPDACRACQQHAPKLFRGAKAKAGATCRSTYYLGAPIFERCNVSRRVVAPVGPHAHCPTTVNENPDADDVRSRHTWLPSDFPVGWPDSWR